MARRGVITPEIYKKLDHATESESLFVCIYITRNKYIMNTKKELKGKRGKEREAFVEDLSFNKKLQRGDRKDYERLMRKLHNKMVRANGKATAK